MGHKCAINYCNNSHSKHQIHVHVSTKVTDAIMVFLIWQCYICVDNINYDKCINKN